MDKYTYKILPPSLLSSFHNKYIAYKLNIVTTGFSITLIEE